jgi:hypothetical protein
MAGVVETTNTFATNEVITSTLLNNIIDQTLFTSDALASNPGTLALVSGKMKVATSGITSNEMGVNAVTANAIAADAVTTVKILDANVTTAKILDSNVTTAKILDSNVTTAKILDSNVTTAKIADANITAAKLSGAQTGSAPIFGVRAWVVFDMTRNAAGGTDSANTARYIYASGNVSSVTKNGTGDFTVNFTTSLPDANFTYAGSGLDSDSGGDVFIGRASGMVKNGAGIQLRVLNNNATALNPTEVAVSFIR